MEAEFTIAVEDPGGAEVRALLAELDDYLGGLYPAESNYGSSPETLARDGGVVLVARRGGEPAGCGALLPIGEGAGEVKRMYVRPAHRGAGLGRRLLAAVEAAARERGLDTLKLEAGPDQPEALALYTANGFAPVPCWGAYAEDPLSRCYAKHLA